MTERILSTREVMAATGRGRTTIWRLAKDGAFPAPRQIVGHRIGWLASEVEAWILSRPVVPGLDAADQDDDRAA